MPIPLYPSSIPLVTDTFVTDLQQIPDLADVEIMDSLGHKDEPFTVLAIGDVRSGSWNRRWSGFPPIHIDEDFDLNFWIRVREKGQTQKETRDRAFGILSYMDAYFIDQVTLKGRIEQVLTVALQPTDFIEIPTIDGYQSYIAGVVACSTRITPGD